MALNRNFTALAAGATAAAMSVMTPAPALAEESQDKEVRFEISGQLITKDGKKSFNTNCNKDGSGQVDIDGTQFNVSYCMGKDDPIIKLESYDADKTEKECKAFFEEKHVLPREKRHCVFEAERASNGFAYDKLLFQGLHASGHVYAIYWHEDANVGSFVEITRNGTLKYNADQMMISDIEVTTPNQILASNEFTP